MPLSTCAHYEPASTLAVNHQGQAPGVTISFNLAPGVALGDAVNAIDDRDQKWAPVDHPSAVFRAPLRPFRHRWPASHSWFWQR